MVTSDEVRDSGSPFLRETLIQVPSLGLATGIPGLMILNCGLLTPEQQVTSLQIATDHS